MVMSSVRMLRGDVFFGWLVQTYKAQTLHGTAMVGANIQSPGTPFMLYMPTLGWCQGGQCKHIFQTWSVWELLLLVVVSAFVVFVCMEKLMSSGRNMSGFS